MNRFGVTVFIWMLINTALVSAECNNQLMTDTPAERFILNGATVVDTHTGLMWKRCVEGYIWEQNTCVSISQPERNWQVALQGAAGEAFADYNDWRLPNKKELDSIVDRRCYAPAVNDLVFPSTPSALHWSSSPNAIRFEVSWVVDFERGGHRGQDKQDTAVVRFVRDYR